MLIPPTYPSPMREFLHDGLRLLFARLATLTEEFRAGLIAAIGRTLADGAEYLMERVLPQIETPRVRPPDDREDPFDEPGTDFEDSRSIPRPFPHSEERSPESNVTTMPLTRAVIAAGLNALGVWLLRVGFVPTSAVIAMLGGMILMFRPAR